MSNTTKHILSAWGRKVLQENNRRVDYDETVSVEVKEEDDRDGDYFYTRPVIHIKGNHGSVSVDSGGTEELLTSLIAFTQQWERDK